MEEKINRLKKRFGKDRIKTGKELPRQLTCFTGKGEFDLNKIEPVKNSGDFFIKPRGGLWTSSLVIDEEFPSDWLRWAIQECWYDEESVSDCHLLDVEDDAIVYEINTPEDLQKLCDTLERAGCPDILEQLNCASCLDWENISKVFDGVRLTEQGQWNTRLSQPNFNGWDSESTVWFRNKFKKREKFNVDKDLFKKYPC